MSSGKGTRRRVGKLSRARRLAAYGLGLAVWASGSIWLIFDFFVRVEDQFGWENPHPQQGAWMMLHALVALPCIWLFGLLWIVHVKPTWKKRERRMSGGSLWSFILWLGISGYALYYIGNDTVRNVLSLSHWIPGLAALAIFLIHFRSAREKRELQPPQDTQ